MKKIAIPIILFVVIAVASIAFIVSISYRIVQYQKDAIAHVFDVQEDGGELVAEYNGVTTRVLGKNVNRVFKAKREMKWSICFQDLSITVIRLLN